MDKKTPESKTSKCYNSWSCILSVMIIVFILGSIVYDLTISKPKMRKDIIEIRENVKILNQKIDAQQNMYIMEIDSIGNVINPDSANSKLKNDTF